MTHGNIVHPGACLSTGPWVQATYTLCNKHMGHPPPYWLACYLLLGKVPKVRATCPKHSFQLPLFADPRAGRAGVWL